MTSSAPTSSALEQRVTIALAVLILAAAVAMTVAMLWPTPVCHAPTEDSVITDCTYSHGAWRPER